MSEIERLIGLLELRTDEYRVYAVEAAEAEVAYKKSHAIAHLKATGTVSEREAEATLAADGEASLDRSREGFLPRSHAFSQSPDLCHAVVAEDGVRPDLAPRRQKLRGEICLRKGPRSAGHRCGCWAW